MVCGDDVEAKAVVQDLAISITGKRGVDAGSLRLARQLELLTEALISVNRQHKTRSGLAIVGVEQDRPDE